MRFAPGNLAPMKTLASPRAFPVAESDASKSPSILFHELFLSQQNPSESLKTAVSELRPEAEVPLASPEPGSAGRLKSAPIAAPESIPSVAASLPTHPALTQARQILQPGVAVAKVPIADVSDTEAGTATERAGGTNSGSRAAAAQIVAASSGTPPQAAGSIPVRRKEQIKPTEDASSPEKRKSETGNVHAIKVDRAPSSWPNTGASPVVPLAAIAEFPAGQSEIGEPCRRVLLLKPLHPTEDLRRRLQA